MLTKGLELMYWKGSGRKLITRVFSLMLTFALVLVLGLNNQPALAATGSNFLNPVSLVGDWTFHDGFGYDCPGTIAVNGLTLTLHISADHGAGCQGWAGASIDSSAY